MSRLALIMLMAVAIGYVIADEGTTEAPATEDDEDNSCTETADCSCGSVCNEGACVEGCMLFDTFMAAGSEAEVYGRKCRCGTVADERGMPLECAEGEEFTGAPEGVSEWENNPACEV
ncbi:hypothetical protein ACF0H5_002463 [Mactra antiquata]